MQQNTQLVNFTSFSYATKAGLTNSVNFIEICWNLMDSVPTEFQNQQFHFHGFEIFEKICKKTRMNSEQTGENIFKNDII